MTIGVRHEEIEVGDHAVRRGVRADPPRLPEDTRLLGKPDDEISAGCCTLESFGTQGVGWIALAVHGERLPDEALRTTNGMHPGEQRIEAGSAHRPEEGAFDRSFSAEEEMERASWRADAPPPCCRKVVAEKTRLYRTARAPGAGEVAAAGQLGEHAMNRRRRMAHFCRDLTFRPVALWIEQHLDHDIEADAAKRI